MDKYKGIALVAVADGSMVLFWKDLWNRLVPSQAYPELFSFAKDQVITYQAALDKPQFIQNFNLPLTTQAHAQLINLQQHINSMHSEGDSDKWSYIRGNALFSTSKFYKALIGQRVTHPAYRWIWKSKCRLKHKVFCWLLLKDRLSTRDILRRKHMELDSDTCELCILQHLEIMAHLFFRCNFAKACWNSIGVTFISTGPILRIIGQIKEKLAVLFYMEIIILMM